MNNFLFVLLIHYFLNFFYNCFSCMLQVRKARNKGPMGAGPIGPGPNATEEEKKHFRDAAKSVSANM